MAAMNSNLQSSRQEPAKGNHEGINIPLHGTRFEDGNSRFYRSREDETNSSQSEGEVADKTQSGPIEELASIAFDKGRDFEQLIANPRLDQHWGRRRQNYPASTIEDANEESGEISGMSQAAFEGSQRIDHKQRKKRKPETLHQSKMNVLTP